MKEQREGLTLREIVKAELYRPLSEGGYPVEGEQMDMQDLIVNNGRVYIARRIAGGDATTGASAMNYMAVGTVGTAPTLTDSLITGEVAGGRKALSSNSAETDNIYTAVATYGGAADSITSFQIQEAGIFNHASSGEGQMMQRVTFATVTLADSDLLKITLQTNVGSNTI